MVVALISRKFSKKDVLRKGMYANDLAMIADKKQELQEVLEQWKGVFKKEGPIMSREKTEEMRVLHQREDLNINLDDNSSTKWMALCNLEEWLMRMSIQR